MKQWAVIQRSVVVVAVGLVGAYLYLWLRTAFVNPLSGPDFFSFYAEAKLVLAHGTAAAYDLTLQQHYQDQTTAFLPGHHAILPYVHPPYFTLLIAPLGWLSLSQAYLLWGTLSLVMLAASAWLMTRAAGLSRRRWLWMLMAGAFLPGFVGIWQGQSDALMLLGVSAAAWAWSKNRSRLTGLCLLLALAKPQLILLLPVLFLFRRSRALVWFLAGLFALVMLSIAIAGMGAWQEFLSLTVKWAVRGGGDFAIHPQTVGSLRNLLDNLPGGRGFALTLLTFALLLAAVSLSWRPHRRRLDFALAVTWSLVLSPYQNIQDLAVFLVPISLVAGLAVSGELRWARAGKGTLVGSYLAMQLSLWPGGLIPAVGGLALALYLTAERLVVEPEPIPMGELSWTGTRPRRVAVLPAYRAEKTLRDVVARIPQGSVDAILLVDDASGDRTAELALELGLNVIKHPSNLGYGGNQKSCYANALVLGAEVVVMLHPDGQYDPALVPALCNAIERGDGDIVLGSRWLDLDPAQAGMPWWKRIGNRFLTGTENAVLGLHLSEYHTGYRAYSRRFLETIPFAANSNDFVFDTQILVAAAAFRMKIGEIPAVGRYFSDASSIGLRTSTIYGLKTLGCLVRYWFHRVGVPCAWLTPTRPKRPRKGD
ncbi:MAG TPA: glycosyltransferase 87 family protein [Candidatus Dormibacteraeota bacterium]|nr:glycosyltransferase 87 family protein [Candidatus Dormibacteraeota bacterium]